MWDIQKHLKKGENIIEEENPSLFFSAIPVVIGVLLIPTIIGALVVFGLIYLYQKSTKYVVTNMRIINRHGIISEDVKSLSFNHITSLRVKQGIIGKIFNFGSIYVDTSGSGVDVDFEWDYVINPIALKNKIEERIS